MKLAQVAASLVASGWSDEKALAKARELLEKANEQEALKEESGLEVSVASALDKVPNLQRKGLLIALLGELGHSIRNEDDAEKLFNKWLRYELRSDDFQNNGPFADISGGFPEGVDLHWQLFPLRTKAKTPPPRPRVDGEHETAPWWTTDDCWWPELSREVIKEWNLNVFGKDPPEKDVLSKPWAFRSRETARRVLTSFARWLQEQREEAERNPVPRKPRVIPRSAKSGRFVSPKDNGAGWNKKRSL